MQLALPTIEPIQDTHTDPKRKKKHWLEIYAIETGEVELHHLTIRGDLRGGNVWYLYDKTVGMVQVLRFKPYPSWNTITAHPHALARRVRDALMNGTLHTLKDADGRTIVLGHQSKQRRVLRAHVRSQVERVLEAGTRTLSPIYELEYVYSTETGGCRLIHHNEFPKTLRHLGMDSTWIRLRVQQACNALLDRNEYQALNPELF